MFPIFVELNLIRNDLFFGSESMYSTVRTLVLLPSPFLYSDTFVLLTKL